MSVRSRIEGKLHRQPVSSSLGHSLNRPTKFCGLGPLFEGERGTTGGRVLRAKQVHTTWLRFPADWGRFSWETSSIYIAEYTRREDCDKHDRGNSGLEHSGQVTLCSSDAEILCTSCFVLSQEVPIPILSKKSTNGMRPACE